MMLSPTPSFVHDFQPGAVHFGRSCVSRLEEVMAKQGLENALVVCGQNVGANRDVMDPLETGIGDRLVGVFDETTPEKKIETAFDGIERMTNADVDVLVSVGSGSSLDVARFMAVLAGKSQSRDGIRTEIEREGSVSVPERESLVPILSAPTTFAGADLSVAAAITYSTETNEQAETVAIADQLMPKTLFYDPELFETTPMDVLAGSAINGFDKALETVYSAFSNPITDATAIRSLKYFRDSLPELRDSDDPEVMERAVMGVILAQHGVSMPDAYKLSIVHAFGHALRNEFGIQQGVAHAIMVPHTLRTIFEHVDGQRRMLAEGLVLEEEVENEAEAVIAAIEEIRNGLDLPSRLREIEGPTEEGLHDAAVYAHEDPFMSLGPDGFDPTVDDIEATLRKAW